MNTLEEAIAERLREVGLDPVSEGTAGADFVLKIPGSDQAVIVQITSSGLPRVPSDDQSASVMLARRQIEAQAGRSLRDRGQPYVDSGGNMWLDVPGYYVQIEGRRPTVAAAVEGASSRAFRPGGLRLVFVLLCWPERMNDPIRRLAGLAGISLGAAQGALADLEADGFLSTGTDGVRRLVDVGRLVRRWLELYPTRLRPKLESLALTGQAPQWWIDRAAGRWEDGVLLSGEAALAELQSSIRPLTTTLWGRPPWGKARQHARLERSADPNTFLYERFWDESLDSHREPAAPALLIYADAVASGEPRQIEAAEDFRRSDAELRRLFER